MRKIIVLFMACLSGGWLMANHWTPVDAPYEENMALTCIIQIDDVEQTNDAIEVGVFCGTECRGAAQPTFFPPTQRYIYQVTVFGEEGDTLTFRLYDHALQQELDLTPPDAMFFHINGYGTLPNPYVLDFSEDHEITQANTFSAGWNWWSTYVEADDLLEQMENSLGIHGVTVKSQNGYVQYMPDFNIWYGSPGFGVYNEYCYLIQTTADCDVEVTGAQASPTNHPITLSFGWNWIGFPCMAHQSFETAFSGIVPRDGDIVKSQTQGFASYMSAFNIWYGTLADYGIDPGMGLLYRSFNGETFTFTYPESRGEEPAGNNFTENNHWKADYHAYPNNMTVIAIVELGDMEVNSENYELAAFANGECRGSVKLMHVAPLDRYMAFLTVAGDEASELRFGLYDIETGTVETECLTTLQYETNATIGNFESPYVVRFRSTMGVDELGSRINVFPNPVARGEKVNIDLKADNFGKMRIEIVNALGEVVEKQGLASPQTIHAPNTAGVYTLRITVDGEGTCCRKLVVK